MAEDPPGQAKSPAPDVPEAPRSAAETDAKPADAVHPDLLPDVALHDAEAIARRDQAWLDTVYRPNEAQLTVRALLAGALLGSLLCASNLYLGLKIGWLFGMSITSAILSFAIFRGAAAVIPTVKPLTLLENNSAQTTASAAAYMCGAGLVSSFPALTMLHADGTIPSTVPELSGWRMAVWLLGTSLLGVLVAVPLKRSLINAEQLRFPTGSVCAATLRAMNEAGKAGVEKARALIFSGLFAAALKFLFECKMGVLRHLPETIKLPFTIRGLAASVFSLQLNTSLLLYAAGAIIGIKVGASLFLGAIVNYGFVAPWLYDEGVLRVAPAEVLASADAWKAFDAAARADHVLAVKSVAGIAPAIRGKWSVWPGTSIMVSASIVALLFRWRTVARAMSGLFAMFGKRGARDPLAPVEVPSAWFLGGLLVTTILCAAMQAAWFEVPFWLGLVSVGLAFMLSTVAGRAVGETDVNPVGAMGKIAQLVFGGLVPGSASANLMSATVTAGSVTHASDMLTEVKTGYLLGASPRKQFLAQLVGVFAGALVCVPVYQLIAKPEKIGTELAAPAAMAWMGVAKLLKDGMQNLPRYALPAMAIAGAIGVVLAILDELLPKKAKQYLPSATGIGIALVIDANDSIAMFVGAVAGLVFTKVAKDLSEKFLFSVAGGAVAGEGLMGILVIVLRDVAKVLPKG